MCLEQAINRSSKGKGGVIGETKRKDFVSMWNLIYHERLAVNNLGRKLNGSGLENDNIRVNHEFTKSETDRQEFNISNMIKFMNPAHVDIDTERRLHNILTQEMTSA